MYMGIRVLSVVVNLVCTESILKMIPNLKKLGIDYSMYKEDYHLENLVHLQQLRKIEVNCA